MHNSQVTYLLFKSLVLRSLGYYCQVTYYTSFFLWNFNIYDLTMTIFHIVYVMLRIMFE